MDSALEHLGEIGVPRISSLDVALASNEADEEAKASDLPFSSQPTPARTAGIMTSDEFFGDGGGLDGSSSSVATAARAPISSASPDVNANASPCFNMRPDSAVSGFGVYETMGGGGVGAAGGVSPACTPASNSSPACAGPPPPYGGHLGNQSLASSSDGEITRQWPLKKEAAAPSSPRLPAMTSELPHRLVMPGVDGGASGFGGGEDESVDGSDVDATDAAKLGGLRGALMGSQLGQMALSAWDGRKREERSEEASNAAAVAERHAALATGAVGELRVDVLHATGLVTGAQRRVAASLAAPNLAPTLVFGLAVGDEFEARGEAINCSAARPHVNSSVTPGAPHAETTRIDVRQHWRLPVHDSLTQRLRLRVLIKELAKELTVLSDAELPLSDLRINTQAARAVVLPIAGRRDPALLHLRLTYRLLASPASGNE